MAAAGDKDQHYLLNITSAGETKECFASPKGLPEWLEKTVFHVPAISPSRRCLSPAISAIHFSSLSLFDTSTW